MPLGGNAGAVLLNADWSHRSSRFADAVNTQVGFVGPDDRVTASVGYDTAEGR